MEEALALQPIYADVFEHFDDPEEETLCSRRAYLDEDLVEAPVVLTSVRAIWKCQGPTGVPGPFSVAGEKRLPLAAGCVGLS